MKVLSSLEVNKLNEVSEHFPPGIIDFGFHQYRSNAWDDIT